MISLEYKKDFKIRCSVLECILIWIIIYVNNIVALHPVTFFQGNNSYMNVFFYALFSSINRPLLTNKSISYKYYKPKTSIEINSKLRCRTRENLQWLPLSLVFLYTGTVTSSGRDSLEIFKSFSDRNCS